VGAGASSIARDTTVRVATGRSRTRAAARLRPPKEGGLTHLGWAVAAPGLASSDCERIGEGLLAQPVNAWSSLAFLVAGAWVLTLALGAGARRAELAVYGLAVASNAVGGLLFHGWQWSGARWIHDVAILSVLVFIAAFGAARRLNRGTGWTMRAFGLALAVLGALLAAVPSAAYGVYGLAGVVAGLGEVLEVRREFPEIRREGIPAERRALLGALAALALGATAFFVGRTGGPLCDPASPMQWHAVWHAAAAAAMVLYAVGRVAPGDRLRA